MSSKYTFPQDLEKFKAYIYKAISPILPANDDSPAPKDFFSKIKRTDAGRNLPEHYLVYFLLVDLLGFDDYGRSEKVAWSIPIAFNNKVFLIEYRKMGLGLFAYDAQNEEIEAKKIVALINKAAKKIKPYFTWQAGVAMDSSDLNVENHSAVLFERYNFFLNQYKSIIKEIAQTKIDKNITLHAIFPLMHRLNNHKEWLALSTIDAFFSWTEHIFIHLAIFKENLYLGKQVAKLALADWQSKFKAALDITNELKPLYDQLCLIKEQIRNYISHGAFGKQGEAFKFHSTIGAVPVFLPKQKEKFQFSFVQNSEFRDDQAIAIIESFISKLWAGSRETAGMYIQESRLPIILSLVKDGTYTEAMETLEKMDFLIQRLSEACDNASNMDWF